MTSFPPNTIIVGKIDGSGHFREDVLDCTDINAVASSGSQTISGQKTFTQDVILSGSITDPNCAITKQYVTDQLALSGAEFVHLVGDESISGVKTFNNKVAVGGGGLTGENLLQINATGHPATVIAGVSSIVEIDSEDPNKSDFQYRLSSDTAGAPAVILSRSRGTLNNPTPVQSGDWNGAFLFLSYGGADTGWGQTGWVSSYIDGPVGSGSGTPGKLVLGTTALSGTTPVEQVNVDSNGNVNVLNGHLNIGQNVPNKLNINIYGTAVGSGSTMGAGIGLNVDGTDDTDKGIWFSEEEDYKWQKYIFRNEAGKYFYTYNYASDTDPLVVSQQGNFGINKMYNLPDYYDSCYFNNRGGIEHFTVASGGSGYHVGDILTVTQFDAHNAANLTVTTTGVGGSVTGATVTSGGKFHALASTVSCSGGLGSNCKVNITKIYLDDLHFGGVYTLAVKLYFTIKITTTGVTDKFDWSISEDGITQLPLSMGGGTGVAITGAEQDLMLGATVKFDNVTGHALNSSWSSLIASQEPESVLQINPTWFKQLLLTPNYNAATPTYENHLYTLSNDVTGGIKLPGGSGPAIYLGMPYKFDRIHFDIARSGSNFGLVLVDYYNGSNWVTMSGTDTPTDFTSIDGLNSFKRSGVIYWTDPEVNGPWTVTTPVGLDSSYEMYWIRLRPASSVLEPPELNYISPTSNNLLAIYKGHLSGWPAFKVDASGQVYIGISEGYNDSQSSLQINGSLGYKLEEVTTNLILTREHNTLFCINTSDITLTLPDATQCNGRQYSVKKLNTGYVTIQPIDNQLIDGLPSLTISNLGKGYIIMSDGTNWHVFVEGNRSNPNYVVVESIDDFPRATSGVITLNPNVTYKIRGVVALGSTRINIANNNVIVGETTSKDILTYTGSNTLLSCSGYNCYINNIGIECPTSGSKAIAISGSTYTEVVLSNIAFGSVSGCYELGTVYSGISTTIEGCSVRSTYKGFTLSGTSYSMLRDTMFGINQENITYLTCLNSSYESIDIRHNKFCMMNGQYALNIPQLSISGAGGFISDNNFFTVPGTTPSGIITGGLTHTNVYWTIKDNFGLRDHRVLGVVKFDANSSTTTCSNINNYYKAAGTNATAYTPERLNTSTNNRIINLNPITKDYKLLVTGAISCGTANQTTRVAVYKNGTTKIAETEVRISAAGNSVPFALNDAIDLALNDYLEVWVRNSSATNALTVEFMQFRVSD